jgi:hypothetical protein
MMELGLEPEVVNIFLVRLMSSFSQVNWNKGLLRLSLQCHARDDSLWRTC